MEQFELNLNECLIHPEIDIEAGMVISDRPILICYNRYRLFVRLCTR